MNKIAQVYQECKCEPWCNLKFFVHEDDECAFKVS